MRKCRGSDNASCKGSFFPCRYGVSIRTAGKKRLKLSPPEQESTDWPQLKRPSAKA